MFEQLKPTIDFQEKENGLREINNIVISRILVEAKKYQTLANELENILEEKQEQFEKTEEE